ncbi:MAG: nuclease, partial [Bradyrhizobium sp.]|nr:nuclease [Bradyrhizobium sp.]
MRFSVVILAVLWANPGWAAGTVVKDGGTVQVAGVTYRLDGIDAPELDQICIDEHADPWSCGVEARDQLTKLIGDRTVRCEDLGLA